MWRCPRENAASFSFLRLSPSMCIAPVFSWRLFWAQLSSAASSCTSHAHFLLCSQLYKRRVHSLLNLSAFPTVIHPAFSHLFTSNSERGLRLSVSGLALITLVVNVFSVWHCWPYGLHDCVVGGGPVHCRISSSYLGLYSLNISSIPPFQVTTIETLLGSKIIATQEQLIQGDA